MKYRCYGALYYSPSVDRVPTKGQDLSPGVAKNLFKAIGRCSMEDYLAVTVPSCPKQS